MDYRPLRDRLHEIIFEADTREGKLFDVLLLILILVSVIAVILESVDAYNARYHRLFVIIEWILTIGFTLEYFLRIYVVNRPLRYMFSFFGIIDFLSILPTYLSLFLLDTHYLVTIRILRLLRIFRILKLTRYLVETQTLAASLMASRRKIGIFISTVMLLVIILGSIMYIVEGGHHGFDSIPKSMYWAIVTLTTVGYGDITPHTPLGQFISAFIMLLGYGIIAVPTGIVSAEWVSARERTRPMNTQVCQHCYHDNHEDDAQYCKMCGYTLDRDNE